MRREKSVSGSEREVPKELERAFLRFSRHLGNLWQRAGHPARARSPRALPESEFSKGVGGCGLAPRDSLAIEPPLICAASSLRVINRRPLSLGALTLPSPSEQDSERMRFGENLAQSSRGPRDGVRRMERGRRQTTAGDLLGSSGPRTRVPGQGKVRGDRWEEPRLLDSRCSCLSALCLARFS